MLGNKARERKVSRDQARKNKGNLKKPRESSRQQATRGSLRSLPRAEKSSPNLPNTIPKASQDPPKPSQKRLQNQIPINFAFWSVKFLFFRRPGRSKALPIPPKIDAKSFQKHCQKQHVFQKTFLMHVQRFWTSKSIDFGFHFGPWCHLLLKGRILKNVWFSSGKTTIFHVSSFEPTTKINTKVTQNEIAKNKFQNPPKILILGRMLALKIHPKSMKKPSQNDVEQKNEKMRPRTPPKKPVWARNRKREDMLE